MREKIITSHATQINFVTATVSVLFSKHKLEWVRVRVSNFTSSCSVEWLKMSAYILEGGGCHHLGVCYQEEKHCIR